MQEFLQDLGAFDCGGLARKATAYRHDGQDQQPRLGGRVEAGLVNQREQRVELFEEELHEGVAGGQ